MKTLCCDSSLFFKGSTCSFLRAPTQFFLFSSVRIKRKDFLLVETKKILVCPLLKISTFRVHFTLFCKPLCKVFLFNLVQFSSIMYNTVQLSLEKHIPYLHLERQRTELV
jgi:hypothetical protein